MSIHDVIVLGAGGAGSAAACHAARRGLSTLLIEQFAFDHPHGSSHGASRIIRYAYDHPIYIEMAEHAFAGWRELQAQTGEHLMFPTGGIDFGPAEAESLGRVQAALDAQQIHYEMLSPRELQARFPAFRLPNGFAALFQKDAALLQASHCVQTLLRLAHEQGAVLLAETPVLSIEADASGCHVETRVGRFSARQLVVTAGAWANDLLEPLGMRLPLQPVGCQENYYTTTLSERTDIGSFPVFIAHLGEKHGYRYMPYGLPSVNGSGLKMSLHGGPPIDPHDADRSPLVSVSDQMIAFADQYLDVGPVTLSQSRGCLYTMTPDEHFIIDVLPTDPRIVIGAACSGHGFKFCNLIGEWLINLALGEPTSVDVSFFRASRFDRTALR